MLDRDQVLELDLSDRSPRNRGGITVRCRASRLFDDDPRFVALFAYDDSEMVRMEATRRDFVANVSHELKTPVGAMALLAEALLESVDDPPDTVRHFGQRVQSEAQRLGNMVTELISLSKLQGAEKMPDLEIVDVDAVVQEALERTALTAENADIAVATDRATGYEVLGDQSLLVTALTNLVENAIAYSPKGSPVSVSRALREGGKVAISVTDRGIGIAQEDQERVFERFFRVDKARSRATGGTGLGLAIVKHVAANHNGEIVLWSRPGTGSTFTLLIPPRTSRAATTRISSRPGTRRRPDNDEEPPPHCDERLCCTRCGANHATVAVADDERYGGPAVTSVLIVEDEESLADPLAFLLRKEVSKPPSSPTGRRRWRSSTVPARTSSCSI